MCETPSVRCFVMALCGWIASNQYNSPAASLTGAPGRGGVGRDVVLFSGASAGVAVVDGEDEAGGEPR